MERVAFLIERTGQRIGCMLNPEGLTLRRATGVLARRLPGGAIAGAGLSDDPLIFTGGGRTELDLDLLFDIEIAGSSVTSRDVRELTGPLWRLTENAREDGAFGRPPTVRFLWGTGWNIPGIIVSIAERLERFDQDGLPMRSWLRLRLVRTAEPPAEVVGGAKSLGIAVPELPDVLEGSPETPIPGEQQHEVLGARSSESPTDPIPGHSERLDQIAHQWSGDPSHWRVLAYLNNVIDPLRIIPGTILRLPPLRGIVNRANDSGGGTP